MGSYTEKILATLMRSRKDRTIGKEVERQKKIGLKTNIFSFVFNDLFNFLSQYLPIHHVNAQIIFLNVNVLSILPCIVYDILLFVISPKKTYPIINDRVILRE